MALQAALTQTQIDILDGAGGRPSPLGPHLDALVGTRLQDLANLALTTNGNGASLIGVEDAAANFTGTDIEAVLAELYTAATSAGSDAIDDTNGYYTVDTVNGGFDALGVQIGGDDDATFAFTEDNVVADDDAVYAALDKLDLKWGDLASTANTEGASLVGVEDAAAYYAGAEVEAVLTALGTQIGGDTDATFGFTEDNILADDDAVYAALDKLDLAWGDLASNANGEGASMVGIEDAGGHFFGTTVEAALTTLGLMQQVNLADPGDGNPITVARSAHVDLNVGAGVETNAMGSPAFVGQRMSFVMGVDGGGTRAITAAVPINQAGDTVMTFGELDDFIELNSIVRNGVTEWQIIANEGVALS